MTNKLQLFWFIYLFIPVQLYMFLTLGPKFHIWITVNDDQQFVTILIFIYSYSALHVLNLGYKFHIWIIVYDDQQDATILVYLFIPIQLYMFLTWGPNFIYE